DQASQFAQRPQVETGTHFDYESCTADRIEHPAGHRDRRPIVKLENELLPTSIARAPQDAAGRVAERVVSVTDRHRRRGMSSVMRRCDIATPLTCPKRVSTSG